MKKYFRNWINYIKPLMFILFITFIIIKVPIFFRPDNLLSVLSQGAVIGVSSIGMTMIILSGEIDISIGAMIYCTGAITTGVFLATHSLLLSFFTAIISGVVCGAINGFGVSKLKVPSLITTLAVSNILTGLGSVIIGTGSTLTAGDAYKVVSQTVILGILSMTWVYILLLVIFTIVIRKTKFGRYIYAIGDNADALRATGVNITKVKMAIFVLSGMLCGICGLLATSRLGGTQYNISLGTEVYCIAAVIVGGTSMTGGRGSIFGTILGVFVVSSLDNILRLMDVSVYIYSAVWGAAIFLIVCIDVLKTKQEVLSQKRRIPNYDIVIDFPKKI